MLINAVDACWPSENSGMPVLVNESLKNTGIATANKSIEYHCMPSSQQEKEAKEECQ